MQEPDTKMDQEGPPQSWGARGRVSKTGVELEMALWAPGLAGPGRRGDGEAKVDVTFELAEGLLVLGWGEQRFPWATCSLAQKNRAGVCAGEEAHEMSQGLI